MKRATIENVRKDLAQVVNEVAFGRVRIMITRHGKEIAAIVSAEDARRIEKDRIRNDRKYLAGALLEGAMDAREYNLAKKATRGLGLDPAKIPHEKSKLISKTKAKRATRAKSVSGR